MVQRADFALRELFERETVERYAKESAFDIRFALINGRLRLGKELGWGIDLVGIPTMASYASSKGSNDSTVVSRMLMPTEALTLWEHRKKPEPRTITNGSIVSCGEDFVEVTSVPPGQSIDRTVGLLVGRFSTIFPFAGIVAMHWHPETVEE